MHFGSLNDIIMCFWYHLTRSRNQPSKSVQISSCFHNHLSRTECPLCHYGMEYMFVIIVSIYINISSLIYCDVLENRNMLLLGFSCVQHGFSFVCITKASCAPLFPGYWIRCFSWHLLWPSPSRLACTCPSFLHGWQNSLVKSIGARSKKSLLHASKTHMLKEEMCGGPKWLVSELSLFLKYHHFLFCTGLLKLLFWNLWCNEGQLLWPVVCRIIQQLTALESLACAGYSSKHIPCNDHCSFCAQILLFSCFMDEET